MCYAVLYFFYSDYYLLYKAVVSHQNKFVSEHCVRYTKYMLRFNSLDFLVSEQAPAEEKTHKKR